VGAGAAALLAGLQVEPAFGDHVWGLGGEFAGGFEGGERLFDGFGGSERLGLFCGEFAARLRFEAAGAVAGFFVEQRREVDDDVGGADGDAGAGGLFDVEAHDRLVDGADLLDVEGAVGEAWRTPRKIARKSTSRRP
jgi:hypothetical protein